MSTDLHAPPAAGPTPRPAERVQLRHLGELVGLCTIAVAQPILAVFANDPETFVFYDAGQAVIMAFALVVVVVPPLALWLGEQAVGLVSLPAQRWVHVVLVGMLGGLFAIQLMGEMTDLSQTVIYGASTLIGVVTAYYYWRFAAVRRGLVFLVPLAPVIAIWFVFLSPVADISSAGDAPESAEVPVGNPAPVVMVQLDEFPTVSLLDASGQIDAELYPNFARLAGDSTWFRNHTTVAGTTDLALPAILSGRYPTLEEAVPTAAAHPDNLFSLLAETYEMHATEQISLMCPELCTSATDDRSSIASLRSLLGLAGDVWRQDLVGEEQDLPGDTAADAARTAFPSDFDFPSNDATIEDQPGVFRRFIDSLDDSNRPRLDFLHVGLPHGPWRFLPSGAEHGYEPPQELVGSLFGPVPPAIRQFHLLQLQHTDQLVGELLDRLEEVGIYDDALVVITADHGVSLTHWPVSRALTSDTYTEMAWTPLFVKAPNQAEGIVDDTPVQIVDILPTIADVLDVSIPWSVDGGSALASTPPGTDRDVRMIADMTTRMEPTDGEFIVFDGEEGFERVLSEGLVSGEGGALARVFGSGPYGRIVGTEVNDLTMGAAAPATARLDEPGPTVVVEADAKTIPAGFVGEIAPSLEGEIAVAVNGTIGTIASRVDLEGTTFVTGVLPEELLPAGTNEIELYLVDGDPGAEVLHSIPFGTG